MESGPAVVLLGAVVLLLIAILVGVAYVATRDRRDALEDAQYLAAVHAKVLRLQQESERLNKERAELLALLAQIKGSLEREIGRLSS